MADEPKKYARKSAAKKNVKLGSSPRPRQSRFAKALMKSKNLAQAAIAAGYSPKYAAQSAHQALQGIRLGVPEILNKPGYSVPVLIENI
jgi:hypothetical protein